MSLALMMACCGSSPRARGTGQRGVARFDLGRFIPACAGNGEGSKAMGYSPPVHPRVRGERHKASVIF